MDALRMSVSEGVRVNVGESVSWLEGGLVVKVLLTSLMGNDDLAFHEIYLCQR